MAGTCKYGEELLTVTPHLNLTCLGPYETAMPGKCVLHWGRLHGSWVDIFSAEPAPTFEDMG